MITETFTAGQRKAFKDVGDFFRLLETTAAVTVEYYKAGREIAEAVNVQAGYSETFTAEQFDEIVIFSATAQTLQFVVRLGNEVRYDRFAGNVAITNTGGAFTSAAVAIANTNTPVLTANTARRYLLIQNNDTSGVIYVNLAGAVATVANGIKIAAGGSLELSNFCPSGAINAIGSLASNVNVLVVAG